KTGRKVEGSGSFEAAGSGRLAPSGDAIEQLALEGDLRLRKVSLDGRALGDLTATARSETGKLRVQIQSAFVGAELAGEGEVALREQFPMQGQLHFRNLDVAAAMRAAGVADWPARVAADGSLSVRGEARAPKGLV